MDEPAAVDAEPDRKRGRWRRTPAASGSAAATASAASAPKSEPASRSLAVLTLVLALLTVAALVVAGYFGLKVREDARVSDARDGAPASAERAAKAMLSYDYRQLPTDRKRASTFLTDDFRKDYLANFTLLEKQKDGTPGAAVQTKTVVTSDVLGSGVMDADEDKVRVLVYVNQTSKKPGADPQIFQNRVAMTMEKDGNRWLVDDLKSY
jgi:Mce-associated membrane protein